MSSFSETPLLLPKQKPTFSCLALGRAATYTPYSTEQPSSDLKAEALPALPSSFLSSEHHVLLVSQKPRLVVVHCPAQGCQPTMRSEASPGKAPGLWLPSHHPLHPLHLQSCRDVVAGTSSQFSSETLFLGHWHPPLQAIKGDLK